MILIFKFSLFFRRIDKKEKFKRRYKNYYAFNKMVTSITTLICLGLSQYFDADKTTILILDNNNKVIIDHWI